MVCTWYVVILMKYGLVVAEQNCGNLQIDAENLLLFLNSHFMTWHASSPPTNIFPFLALSCLIYSYLVSIFSVIYFYC